MPSLPDVETRKRIAESKDLEPEEKDQFLVWIDKILAGLVLLYRNQRGSYVYNDVGNLHLSECYNCKKIAVWVHESLLFPLQ